MSDIKLDWGTGIPPIAATTAKDEIISQQGAEIERLRGLVAEYSNRLTGEALPEIERLRALLAEGFGHIESFRQLLRDGLQRLPTRFAGPCNCTLRCGLVSWQTKAYEMIDDPTKYEDLGHCHQCGEPILLNDDAEVCIQCGGRNVRYSC